MKCCFCGNEIVGYGNSPRPIVVRGKCCDECNIKIIVPYRFFQHLAEKENAKKVV